MKVGVTLGTTAAERPRGARTGGNALAVALILGALVVPSEAQQRPAPAPLAAPAQVQPSAEPAHPPATPPKPAPIDRTSVLILLRSTLLTLHDANVSGNYTVLRDIAAAGFRDANTAARLSEIFAPQRAQKLDLSGVAVLEPQLTVLPQIEPNGMMRMAGFIPFVPSQIDFEFLFVPAEGRWKVFGMAVSVGSPSSAAPATSASPVDLPAPAPSPAALAPSADPKPKTLPRGRARP